MAVFFWFGLVDRVGNGLPGAGGVGASMLAVVDDAESSAVGAASIMKVTILGTGVLRPCSDGC